MKHLKLNYLLVALVFTAVLASCHKDKLIPKTITPTQATGAIYVLNQGNFGANNSTLTYFDYATKLLIPDQYKLVNGTKIGDTGNDIQIYGSKMYIVVNVSSVIDIIDVKTGKLIKQDSLLKSNGAARQPRNIVFYKDKGFISSYDGTVSVIDTATLTISKQIKVGRNPEQMVIANGKLYVANSGGLSFGHPDTTVSVISLNTLTEIKKIPVIANPVGIATDSYGHVYVLSLGDYNTILPGMTIINNVTDDVTSESNPGLGYAVPIVVQGDYAYYFTTDANFVNRVAVYNVKTQTLTSTNFITDGTVITSPYALTVDGNTGEVFVTDAKDYASNGTLSVFDRTGKLEYQLTTGISPGKIALVKK